MSIQSQFYLLYGIIAALAILNYLFYRGLSKFQTLNSKMIQQIRKDLYQVEPDEAGAGKSADELKSKIIPAYEPEPHGGV